MNQVGVKPSHFPVAVFVMATALGPSGQSCSGDPAPGSAADSGVGVREGGASSGEAGASSGPTPADAGAPPDATAASGDDGSSSSGPDSGLDAPDARGAPEPDAGGSATPPTSDAVPGPAWATWPMPNAPSSGLPHPQSYDTSVAGTAVDRVTGLMWQRDAYTVSTAANGNGAQIFGQADAYCAELGLAGFHDWRVPSRIELVSLVDFTVDPAENATVLSVAAAFFLSSSRHKNGSDDEVGYVWLGDGTASTAGGSVGYLLAFMGSLQGSDAVRCVRGRVAATGPHYTVSNGTVHDNWTGLTWQQSPSASPVLPSTVGSYCTGQTLAGGGWRAPSVNELETLWGDSTDPDGVNVDATTFPATAQLNQGLGSSNVQIGSTGPDNPPQWIDVVGTASTFHQEDVAVTLFTLPGAESYSGYWFYAQCVR
jgi:hypothetical protein